MARVYHPPPSLAIVGWFGRPAMIIGLARGAMRLRSGLGGFVAALAGAALTAGGIVSLAVSAPAAPPRAQLAAAASQLPDFGNPNGHAAVPPAGDAVSMSHPAHVIGSGTPTRCTSAAVVKNPGPRGTPGPRSFHDHLRLATSLRHRNYDKTDAIMTQSRG
jgi:hypothetical protein